MKGKVYDMTTTVSDESCTSPPNQPLSTIVDFDNIKGWIRVPLRSSLFALKRIMNEMWAVYVTTVLLWIILGSDSIVNTRCDFSSFLPTQSEKFVYSNCDERPTGLLNASKSFRAEFDAYWFEEVKQKFHLVDIASNEDMDFYTYDVDFYKEYADECERQGINETAVASYQTFNLTVNNFRVTSSTFKYAKTMPALLFSFNDTYKGYDGWCSDSNEPLLPPYFPAMKVVTLYICAALFLLLFFVSLAMKAVDDRITSLTESNDEFLLDFELKDIYTIYITPGIFSFSIAILSELTMGGLLFLDLYFQPPTYRLDEYCKKDILYEIPYKCFVAGNIFFGIIYFYVSLKYSRFKSEAFRKWRFVMQHIDASEQWAEFCNLARMVNLWDILSLGMYSYFFSNKLEKKFKEDKTEFENGVEKHSVFTDPIYLKLRQKYIKIINGQLFVFLEKNEAQGFGVVQSLVDLSKIGGDKEKFEPKGNSKVKETKAWDV